MFAIFARRRWTLRHEASWLAVVTAVQLCLSMTAALAEPTPSASEILQELRAFRECGSVLYVAAHPDDENTQFIAYAAKERGWRVGYLSLTRGEGGQNLIGPELGDPLGVIRTQELLAARRIDGGQQFFTRARDFGYSKSADQTLAKWDRQAVLSDIVRVIRTFLPDVIVTRFPPEGGGTHGHHTASAILAREAFNSAADPKAFPEQFGAAGLSPWQAKRIYWNSFRGADTAKPPLKLDIGGFLPLLGMSVGEISALSRSSHRSQGYGSIGSRGSRSDEFQPLDGQLAAKDLLDPPNRFWTEKLPEQRIALLFPGRQIAAEIDDIIAHFDQQNPATSVPALLNLKEVLEAGLRPHNSDPLDPDEELLKAKCSDLSEIIRHCLGLYIETAISQAEVVPGEKVRLQHTVVLRASADLHWKKVTNYGFSDSGDEADAVLHPNQPIVRETEVFVGTGASLSQPYWLRSEGSTGMYVGGGNEEGILPTNLPEFFEIFSFSIGHYSLGYLTQPVQMTADPAKGEVRKEVKVIPPVWLALERSTQLFSPGKTEDIEVEIHASREQQKGTLSLDAPAGWKVLPPSHQFDLAVVRDHARFQFTVTAPFDAGTAYLHAKATINDKTYNTSRQEIRYEHIPPQLLQPLARVKAVCLDLAVRAKEVGYLPGAGDRTAEALAAMGCHVTTLSGADLTTDRLKSFDAVVVGVRAFNVREDLVQGLSALFAYAEAGGTVVEQYNTPGELKTPRLGPYNLVLSRNLPQFRVTDENSAVTLLAPDHPAFTTPNRITAEDFKGWVQERGLNFPSEWDQEHFTALLACSDPGEAPLRSGLLVARHGKGYFVYTGLSFFRQLPAGVPGAYRLFANLISLGKAS